MPDDQAKSHDEFLGRALHDLKAPARHVTGFSRMLRDSLREFPLSDASRQYLDTIERAGSNMQQILGSLGNYLRLPETAGPAVRFEVAPLLEYCWSELSAEFSPESARMIVQGTGEMESDTQLLAKALKEAMHNSVRFRKPNETLHIDCEVTQVSGRCCIRIGDNGVGIDPASVKRVVEPFQRLPSPGVKCGVGLGLSLCRRAIDLLGGKMTLLSDGVSGTTIIFDLPSQPRVE